MKAEAGDRTERLLALLLLHSMKGANLTEKALQLSVAGFTTVEIADILNIRAAAVHHYLYLARKKKSK